MAQPLVRSTAFVNAWIQVPTFTKIGQVLRLLVFFALGVAFSGRCAIVIKAAQDGKPIDWIPIAKDGADLAPGETYDFTFTPEKSGKIEFTYDQSLLDEHVRQVARVTESYGQH